MKLRCALLTLLLHSAQALAWEADVHFGLTYWLALEAGASDTAARGIARGDILADTGIYDAVHLMEHYACLGKSEITASRDIRDRHFATFAKLPNPPAAREVKPGSEAAWQGVKERLLAPSSDIDSEMENFGLALHRLQDSWAHQGVPDIPKLLFQLCDAEVGWAHPRSRHGWASHDADHTDLWPQDTTQTAAATYEAILKFLDLHKDLRAADAASVPDVMAQIPDFQKARTKAQKRDWFLSRKHKIEDLSFVRSITLEDGDDSFERQIALAAPALPVAKPAAGIPADANDFFLGFFRDWAATDNFAGMVDRYVDVAAARSAMSLGADGADAFQRIGLTLRMWRIRDHGKVAAIGHRPFSAAGPVSVQLVNTLSTLSVARYEAVTQAFAPIAQDGAVRPFAAFRMPSKDTERYIAAARFRHAPYDTVLVLAEKSKDRYRVISIDSMVEH